MAFSRRALDGIYSVVLLAVVILSWSYVIYASRIASHWLMEKRSALLQQADGPFRTLTGNSSEVDWSQRQEEADNFTVAG